jgi:hypothetical protein
MVSGYCKCGFPASLKCDKCGEKYCGNCAPKHVCKTAEPEKTPEQVPVMVDAPAPVLDYKRKPGRPFTKK